jgi:carbamoyl-phosphate synthase small subunit
MAKLNAVLALADGSIYRGMGFGSPGRTSGELVFDTTMTGYEETLTDPSFGGQILTMTYPLIGNYGVTDPSKHPERFESDGIQPSGFVVREACKEPSHRDSVKTIHQYLEENGVPGIEGVDTREITIRIRDEGVMNAALEVAEGEIDAESLLEEARARPDYSEFDFIQLVSTKKPKFIRAETCREVSNEGELSGGKRCVIIDCGMKRSISTRIAERKFDVVVLPYNSTPDDVASFEPRFVMVSNGPGDPLRALEPQDTIRKLAPDYPMMNICMGHQLTGLALGGSHFKLKFGHRGGNQPVKDLDRDKVYITTQNHGFAINPDSLENTGLRVTMTNLNDASIEGMVHQDYRIMTTQFHPEATPGPLDANFLFDEFVNSL